MSNFLWKKLHLCFSSGGIFKSSPSINIPSPSPAVQTDDHNRPSHRRRHTPSIFINNFNFLYDHLSSPTHRRGYSDSLSSSAAFTTTAAAATTATATTSTSSITDAGDSNFDHPAGFATVFASKRRGAVVPPPDDDDDDDRAAVSKLLSGGVAVMKRVESPDPYRDFRRSMQEMVESRNDMITTRDVAADREFLHELLFCYLSLNPKHSHKFIISAFADILVSLLSPSSPEGSCPASD